METVDCLSVSIILSRSRYNLVTEGQSKRSPSSSRGSPLTPTIYGKGRKKRFVLELKRSWFRNSL